MTRDAAVRARRQARAPIDPNAVSIAERAAIPRRQLIDAARLLAAACHLSRVRIVRALAETPLAASDLARLTGGTASGTSQHLRVLRDAGVVSAERSGNIVRYRLSRGSGAQVVEGIARAFDVLSRHDRGEDDPRS